MDQRRNNKNERYSEKRNNRNSQHFRRIVSSEESTNNSNNPNKTTNNWRCGGKTVNRSQPWRGQQNWRHGEKSETKAGKSDEASITLKLHSLKQESVAYFDQIQNTFREMINFTQQYLNLNRSNIEEVHVQNLCLYFEKLNTHLCQFLSTLDQLEKNHAEIKEVKEKTKELKLLITNGKNEIKDKQPYKKAETLTITTSDSVEKSKNVSAKMRVEVETQPEKTSIEMSRELAERRNALADQRMKGYDYRSALQLYTMAIESWPDNVIFYNNRANCLTLLGEYKKALEDGQHLVSIDPTYINGHIHLVKCNLFLGEFNATQRALEELNKHDPNSLTYNDFSVQCKKLITFEKYINANISVKSYQRAVGNANQALRIQPNCVKFKLIKAECLVQLGEIENARKIVTSWRPQDSTSADIRYIQSLCFFYEGNMDEAFKHLEQALSSDPNHKKSIDLKLKTKNMVELKFNGDKCFEMQQFTKAVDYYRQALENYAHTSTFVFDLLYNRGISQMKIGKERDAIFDFNRALNIKPNHLNILLLRAKCHESKNEFDKSITDYENALKSRHIEESMILDIKTKIENVRFAIKHKEVEKKIVAGDIQFHYNKYEEALKMYNDAIDLWPKNAIVFDKRAECYMMMSDYKSAVRESQSALAIENKFANSYKCLIKCYLITGDVDAAERMYKNANEMCSNMSMSMFNEYGIQIKDLKSLIGKINQNYRSNNYKLALESLELVLDIACANEKYKLLKAECLAELERFEEADKIAKTYLQSDPLNSDAIYIRALCMFHKDWEQGLKDLKRVIVLDPDHIKAKTIIMKTRKLKEKEEEGNKMIEQENYRKAISIYSELLAVDLINKNILPNLLYNRALANLKIGNFRSAINDCTKAMSIQAMGTNIELRSKCLLLRADCHTSMRNFKKSIADYEALFHCDRLAFTRVENLLKEAKLSLKRFQSDNYYDILDVDKTATKSDIKKAYKKLALIHHPDKHSDASKDEKLEQQEIFKKINQAHDVLTDVNERAAYDLKK